MKIFIKRHKTSIINFKYIRESIENIAGKIANKYIPNFKKDTQCLDFCYISQSLLKAFYDCEFVVQPKELSFSLLYYANYFGYNIYKLDYYNLYNGSKDIVISDGAEGQLATINLRDDKLASHHLENYLQMALMLRDNEAKSFYANIKPRKPTPAYNPAFWNTEFENLLILICVNEKEKIINQIHILMGFDYWNENLPSYAKAYLKNLFVPLLKVYLATFESKEKEFNQCLLEAVEKHKRYYQGSDEYGESQASLSEGWVSILLTTVCCIAYDSGLKIELESDYIPEWMVKGEFEGLALVVE